MKFELQPVDDSKVKTKRFDTWVRTPGPRVLGATFVDPIRSVGKTVLHSLNKEHSIYSTVNISLDIYST